MEKRNLNSIKYYFRKIIKNIVSNNCKLNDKATYSSKLTFQQVIDKKSYKSEEEKFLLYISAIHGIINDLNDCFPFINMSEIDLSWSVDKVLNIILKAYEKIQVKLEMKDFIKGEKNVNK